MTFFLWNDGLFIIDLAIPGLFCWQQILPSLVKSELFVTY